MLAAYTRINILCNGEWKKKEDHFDCRSIHGLSKDSRDMKFFVNANDKTGNQHQQVKIIHQHVQKVKAKHGTSVCSPKIHSLT